MMATKKELIKQFRTEPDYVIENIIDNPLSEGIDRKIKSGKMIYSIVSAEAKKRGIKRGDSLKRMKSIEHLKGIM
jgi:hypothetical protein